MNVIDKRNENTAQDRFHNTRSQALDWDYNHVLTQGQYHHIFPQAQEQSPQQNNLSTFHIQACYVISSLLLAPE